MCEAGLWHFHTTLSLMFGACTGPMFITTASCLKIMYLFYWCYRNRKLIILKTLVVTITITKRGKCFFLCFILYFWLFCTFWICFLCTGFFFPLNFFNILPKVILTKICSRSLLLLIKAGFILFKNKDIETGVPVFFFFYFEMFKFWFRSNRQGQRSKIPKPFWRFLFYIRAQVPCDTLCFRLHVHKCSYNSSCRVEASVISLGQNLFACLWCCVSVITVVI